MASGSRDFFSSVAWGQGFAPGVLASPANYDTPLQQWARYCRGANLILYVTANTGGVEATVRALHGNPAAVAFSGEPFVPVVGLMYAARFSFDRLPLGQQFPQYVGFRLALTGGTSIACSSLLFTDGLFELPSGYPEPARNPGVGLHYNKFNNGLLQTDGAGQSRIVLDVWA